MPENNTYIPKPIKIISKTELDSNNTLFRFEPVGFSVPEYRPGQFCLITIPGVGESAISFASAYKKTWFELGIRRVGKVTSAISDMNIGDTVGFSGPYGNGYPLDSMKGANILIITGGCGIHPFRGLIQQILSLKNDIGHVRLLFGAKNPNSLLYKSEFKNWESKIEAYTIVDDPDSKWHGETGIVTNLLDKYILSPSNTYALLCGPPIMFKSSCERLIKNHYDPDKIFLSLERKMKCAIGKCQHCVCGHKYVCIDGPIFSYRDVIKMPGAI